MEWMRCNSCWMKVEDKQSEFDVTQCGHVYCSKCVLKAEEKSVQCGATGTISLCLKNPVSLQIAHYFTPPAELLEKIRKVQQFQESQLALCMRRATENEKKYVTFKEGYWATAENLKKVHSKYGKLKVNLEAYQKGQKKLSQTSMDYTPFLYRTPVNQMNISRSSANVRTHLRGSLRRKNPNSSKRNNGVFKVPRQVINAQRSTGSGGYCTGSSISSHSSSNNGKHTSNPQFSHEFNSNI